MTTKSALKKALKKDQIQVNGEVATTATFIKGNEDIVLNIPEDNSRHKPINLQLQVLFEDDHLAVIHKPAGILVSGNSFKTIANALSNNLQASKLANACPPQPVHRLDYATTGILLIGKTRDSIQALNRLFEKHEIQKIYCAVTIGPMDEDGTIDIPVDGKASRSDYQVISSLPSDRFGQLNLVRLVPKTGRRHQLRKHLSGIRNPILGDAAYGKEKLILKGKGLYLHAYSLKFIHPFTQAALDIKDEVPKRFKKIFPQEF